MLSGLSSHCACHCAATPHFFFQFYVLFFDPIASHVHGSTPLDGRVLTFTMVVTSDSDLGVDFGEDV